MGYLSKPFDPMTLHQQILAILANERHPRRLMIETASANILDSLTSGVLAVDLDSRVFFINGALCRRLAYRCRRVARKTRGGTFWRAEPARFC